MSTSAAFCPSSHIAYSNPEKVLHNSNLYPLIADYLDADSRESWTSVNKRAYELRSQIILPNTIAQVKFYKLFNVELPSKLQDKKAKWDRLSEEEQAKILKAVTRINLNFLAPSEDPIKAEQISQLATLCPNVQKFAIPMNAKIKWSRVDDSIDALAKWTKLTHLALGKTRVKSFSFDRGLKPLSKCAFQSLHLHDNHHLALKGLDIRSLLSLTIHGSPDNRSRWKNQPVFKRCPQLENLHVKTPSTLLLEDLSFIVKTFSKLQTLSIDFPDNNPSYSFQFFIDGMQLLDGEKGLKWKFAGFTGSLATKCALKVAKVWNTPFQFVRSVTGFPYKFFNDSKSGNFFVNECIHVSFLAGIASFLPASQPVTLPLLALKFLKGIGEWG